MNKRLFVAGLPFSTTSDELKSLFAEFGSVVSAVVITDRETGRSKGFGFVEMETEEASQGAISKLNGSDFGGRKLIVNEAKPREDRPGGYDRPRKPFNERRGNNRGRFEKRSSDSRGFGGRRH